MMLLLLLLLLLLARDLLCRRTSAPRADGWMDLIPIVGPGVRVSTMQAGANADDSIVDMTVFSQLLEMCVAPLACLPNPFYSPCSTLLPLSLLPGFPSPTHDTGGTAPNRRAWRMLSARPREEGGRTNGT